MKSPDAILSNQSTPRRRRRFPTVCLSITILTLCGSLFAQSDGIIVTASQNVDLPPDSVYYALAIVADPTTTLDEVLTASQSLGLTAQSLSSVNLQQYGPGADQTRIAYAFNLAVAYGKFKETSDKLAALRRSLAVGTPPMDLQVYGITVAPAETARDQVRLTLLSQLFSDARKRADQLASAAGVTLGAVLSVTEAWASTGGYPYYGPYGGPIGPTTLKTAFSLTVRFAVK